MLSRFASCWLTLSLACAGCGAAAGTPAETTETTPRSFPTRIIKLPAPLHSGALRLHLDFCVSIGFNALWVPSSLAGRWTAEDAPDGPLLHPEFVELAERAEREAVQIYLVLEPVLDARGEFVFSDRDGVRRLLRFAQLARREAAVRHFVVCFQGAPLRLTELNDLLEYGRVAAPAHVELTRKIARKLRGGERLWLAPAIFSDRHLDDPRVRYAGALLEALAKLDPRVGVVWSGPQTVSPSITAADLGATRRRLGGRELILDDRFPANGSGQRIPLGLVLGPLRERDPAIVDEVAAYLATPMAELGASRLALLTVADYLRDPTAYDADASWERAIARLAGDRAQAHAALRTQAAEWGGWIGTRNYHTALNDNPQTAARGLRDPAVVASWNWTVKTYPQRMAALGALPDEPFRTDLLLTMARRLAVARSVPLVHRLLAERSSSGGETGQLLRSIRQERKRVEDQPAVVVALDRFLYHAGVALPEETAQSTELEFP